MSREQHSPRGDSKPLSRGLSPFHDHLTLSQDQVHSDGHYSLSVGESPSKKYQRRKRHETRQDKYSYKWQTVDEKLKRPGSEKVVKRRGATHNKPGAMLHEEFRAPNVESTRLTLSRTVGGQLREVGSPQIVGYSDLPDLTFPTMNFLCNNKRQGEELLQHNSVKKIKSNSNQQSLHTKVGYFSAQDYSEVPKQRRMACSGRCASGFYSSVPEPDKVEYCFGGASHNSEDALQGQAESLQVKQYRANSPIRLSHDLYSSFPAQNSSKHCRDTVQTQQPQAISCTKTDCGEPHPGWSANISPDSYTRKALIRSQPGIWRKPRSIDAFSIRSTGDLRKLANQYTIDTDVANSSSMRSDRSASKLGQSPYHHSTLLGSPAMPDQIGHVYTDEEDLHGGSYSEHVKSYRTPSVHDNLYTSRYESADGPTTNSKLSHRMRQTTSGISAQTRDMLLSEPIETQHQHGQQFTDNCSAMIDMGANLRLMPRNQTDDVHGSPYTIAAPDDLLFQLIPCDVTDECHRSRPCAMEIPPLLITDMNTEYQLRKSNTFGCSTDRREGLNAKLQRSKVVIEKPQFTGFSKPYLLY